MNTHVSRYPKAAGYSLIELVIALVLLGVLAALASPSLYGWVNRSRLEAAVNELNADIAQVRMLAVRSGEGAQLQILSATRYELVLPNGVGRNVDLSLDYPRVQLAPRSPLTLPATFTFDSRGLLRDQNQAGVVEATQDGRTVSLRVLATGRAFVEQ